MEFAYIMRLINREKDADVLARIMKAIDVRIEPVS